MSAMFAFRPRNEHAGPGGVVGTLAGLVVSRLDLAVMVKRAASCREELQVHLHSAPSGQKPHCSVSHGSLCNTCLTFYMRGRSATRNRNK